MVYRLANYMVTVSKEKQVQQLHALLGADDDNDIEMIPQTLGADLQAEWDLLTTTNQNKALAIVAKLHKNMNHASSATLVQALTRGRVHWTIIQAAKNYKCEACAMAKRKLLAPVSSGIANVPGQVVGTDNFYWTHPQVQRSVRGQVFVDYGSDVVQVRLHAEVLGDREPGEHDS